MAHINYIKMKQQISKVLGAFSKFGFASTIPRDINRIGNHLANMNKNREKLSASDKKEISEVTLSQVKNLESRNFSYLVLNLKQF
jgi:hypothetical protein